MLHDFARRRAEEMPHRAALLFEDKTTAGFGALYEEAMGIAGALARQGLEPGDTVSFLLPNWREAAPVAIACSALGLTINPIIPIYRDAECSHILDAAETRVIFSVGMWRGFDYLAMLRRIGARLERRPLVVSVRSSGGDVAYDDFVESGRGWFDASERSLPNVDPNGPYMLLYTSGTTGAPKGVVHSHNTLSAARLAISRYWRLGDDDVMIMPSPITHVTGYMMGIEFPFFTGGISALMDRWDAAAAVTFADRVGATATVGATPFLAEMLDACEARGAPIATLRLFACGGAAVPPDLILRAQRVWPHCRTFRIYGSSEAPGVTAGWMEPDTGRQAAQTDGRLCGFSAKLDEGAGARPGEGEILVEGPGLFLGYKREDDNRDAFDADGWFQTGDIGSLVEGAITITGRKKDLIIRGGENLSAKEIEDVLHRHPAVQEAAVVAMPHHRLGEGVCAFVIPRTTLEPEELCRFVEAEGLARQKLPERVELRDSLPRTASGKVRKDRLRAEIAALIEEEGQSKAAARSAG
jgi:acyl-CoA synthetase (AMP-forming)/AMP-acid ligase II